MPNKINRIEQNAAREAMDLVVQYLLQTRAEISQELSTRLDSNVHEITNPTSVGRFKAYKWIQVTEKKSGQIYWLTLFANDYDPVSFNIHTRLGAIQFWRDILVHEKGKARRLGPNESLRDIQYLSLEDKSRENSKCRELGINIIDDAFDAAAIAEQFVEFLFSR